MTVILNPPTSWNTGWLASPLDESTVTGQAPVTVIAGITLVSGTLTYYPANNPGAVATIGTSTTGTGQIALFDTTGLNNGGYFLLLNATNSVGVTQTSQAYVTVAGDYKPGRVTATVTDLTVPSTDLAIQIQRTYDSLLRSQQSDFGYGWRLGTRVDLLTSPMGDVTFTLGGRRRTSTSHRPPPSSPTTTYRSTRPSRECMVR